jgi:TRAP-type mannitol/chloroaromatic compound transport system permease small subunit
MKAVFFWDLRPNSPNLAETSCSRRRPLCSPLDFKSAEWLNWLIYFTIFFSLLSQEMDKWRNIVSLIIHLLSSCIITNSHTIRRSWPSVTYKKNNNKLFVDRVIFYLPSKRRTLTLADFLGVLLYSLPNCPTHWKRWFRQSGRISQSVSQSVSLSVWLSACQQFLLITELRTPK